MAQISWDSNDGNQQPDDSGYGQAPAPAPASNKDAIFGQIANQYQSALGRSSDRIGGSEYLNWAKDMGGGQWGFTTPDWQSQIANSAEGKAYAASKAAPAAGTQSGAQFDQGWFSSTFGTPGTPGELTALEPRLGQYGIKVLRNAAGVAGKIQYPDGRIVDVINAAGLGGRGFQWLTDGGGSGGADTSSTYGNSASTELYVNEILRRLKQLHEPINDPMLTALQKLALERVQTNQGAPFTAGDDAALTAHYREPLTQARDAEYQHNREQIARRGMMASSGLLDVLDNQTNRAYQSSVAQGANDLGVQAIAEKNRRAQESLAILASLVQAGQSQRSEQNAQSSDLLRTAALLPGLDESRMRLLLDASSGGQSATSSSLSALLSLAQMNQSANATNAGTSQANADTFGAYLARILAGMGA